MNLQSLPMSDSIPEIEHLYFFLIVKDQTAFTVKTDIQVARLGYQFLLALRVPAAQFTGGG
ncbi:MAG: hypothetical protein U0938_00220 [Thiobacillus sp.]|nr:hypothetical protein [Thiobacillus sp.]